MKSNKGSLLKKISLVVIFILGILGLYYRGDVPYYEVYYPVYTFTVLATSIYSFRVNFSKKWLIVYLILNITTWLAITYMMYVFSVSIR